MASPDLSQLDHVHIDELAALLAVASAGTCAAAGLALQRHATVVSKRIVALEARLGVRLVERTTRSVRLTEAGERLAAGVRRASDMLSEAALEASAGAQDLRGRLRIALPAAMGRLWIAPRLPAFFKRYPGLTVEVEFSERSVDLVAEGFDAAVRIGVLADSRLVARRLSEHRRVLGASPAYLAQHGPVHAPEALAAHNCLSFAGFETMPHWRLTDGQAVTEVVAKGTVVSNDSLFLLEAARQDIGILGAGEWLMAREFAAGTLQRVLPAWSFDTDGGIYLVRPSVQYAPARILAFADWLYGEFQDGGPWSHVLLASGSRPA